jgi:arsenate reductase (thioredoxin)
LAAAVCDRAKQACIICTTELKIPTKSTKAREVIHKSFEDPALATVTNEEQINVFRRIRDDMKDWIVDAFG